MRKLKLKAESDDTKEYAACAVANLAINEFIREQIAGLDSILEGLGDVMKDAKASYYTKREAVRAVANLALNEAILEKIVSSGHLGSILECLVGVMNDDSKATADTKRVAARTKRVAARAVANLASNKAIREKIVKLNKLGIVLNILFTFGYVGGGLCR